MERRAFLRSLATAALGAAAAALEFDPERTLWVPGKKTTFDLGDRPRMPESYGDEGTGLARIGSTGYARLIQGDVFTIVGYCVINPATGQRDPELGLQKFTVTQVVSSDDIRVERVIEDRNAGIRISLPRWQPDWPVQRERTGVGRVRA